MKMFDCDRKYCTLNEYRGQFTCMFCLGTSFTMGVIRPFISCCLPKSYNIVDLSQCLCMKWTDEDNNPHKCCYVTHVLFTLLCILLYPLILLLAIIADILLCLVGLLFCNCCFISWQLPCCSFVTIERYRELQQNLKMCSCLV